MENIKLEMNPSQVRGFSIDKHTTEETLNTLGVYAMDALPASVTTATVSTPLQFLQYFCPNAIRIATAARKIDELIGRTVVASWEDQEIVTPVIEQLGGVRPYGDYTSTILSSVNVNYERRTIERFETGIEVTLLEEQRAAKQRLNSAEEKRNAAVTALAIELNRIGFFGYNDGSNRTYGFLNDPNLPAYVTVAQGAGLQTTWQSKTFDEICTDIRTAFSALRVKTGDLFDPYKDECTLAVSSAVREYLTKTTQLGGYDVERWIKETFKGCRIVSAPELNQVNGGANVFYLYADKIEGRKVFDHNVVTALRSLGVERTLKGYAEAYSNATAGVMLNMPIGVVRYTGV